MKTHQVIAMLLLVSFAMMTVVGCSKVSKGNYDKIENDMTLDEVESILGKGTEKAGIGGAIGDITGSGKVLMWEEGEKTITVTFANDKVVGKVSKGIE